MLNTSFLMYATEAVEFDLGKIRYVPNPEGLPSDAVSCEDMLEDALPPLTGDNYNLFADFNAQINASDQYTTEGCANS